jgi:hypothetical protein
MIADVWRCRTEGYRFLSHLLRNKALLQLRWKFRISLLRTLLPNPQWTRESDKVFLVTLRMSWFAKRSKGSTLWVEDSIVKAWMRGG